MSHAEESKESQKDLYTFSVAQKQSLAQQISLLEIQVVNTQTKAMYSNKFTGTSIKKQGFPSNDLNRVEAFIKRAYAGETEGLTIRLDEKAKKGGEGVMEVTITKEDQFFPMVMVLKLNEVKREETAVLRCVAHTRRPTFFRTFEFFFASARVHPQTTTALSLCFVSPP